MGKSGNPAKRNQPTGDMKKEIILCWCDNGLVDGKFTEGLVYSILTSDVPITSALRVQGNQIGRQRQTALDVWYKNTQYDWILWVDSDIVITNDVLAKLWHAVNKQKLEIISGTYFISKENEQSVMMPFPALFAADPEDRFSMSFIHPMPENSVMPVDYAGFGFLLMNRSVIDKMKAFHGDRVSFFIETSAEGDSDATYISEDVRFFMMMKEAGVQLYCHTGATVKHMKRFAFDEQFYKMYWGTQAHVLEQKKAGS